ncbi:HAMP domain-containing histidine kinase [Novosphingobium sp. KCTC 2891]|uniref:sensor histidine kinase n=1 Tax=Novosphingobium sp. KCTC 2891 TaxID=2989730 RepID=UPI0022233094|nr:HAMP domain-containing sensor histidine kinase [Novosphingobium sp. KCTC 2891]MCW1383122.1 HAMP domain-containing histidine kinase [Novosphingobium sp. KCTC 2891]
MSAAPRRFSPTMVRLVTAVFVLQLLSSAAAIFFLRTQMLDVVRADRVRQVIDVRDDLLAAYYDGGHEELAEFITSRRGSAADPTVFIALTGGETGGAPVLANLTRAPTVPISARPVPVMVRHGAQAPLLEGVAVAGGLSDGSKLVVGVAGGSDRRLDLAFATAIGVTIAVAVVFATLSALVLGIVISRRTHEIAETAAQLASGNFGARVSTDEAGDGFDHLRLQINLMAERIDQLVSQLGAVSGALAHDLRSPVTRLSAAIETAMARTEEPRALEALEAARADAEGLRAMLETALEISRLEGGVVQDRRTPLDLAVVAEDLVELYEPLAEQAGVQLAADLLPVTVVADRELLSRALSNLIDNAIKYGGTAITVTTRTQGSRGEITVADNGPGIAPEDRDRAVERFVRLDNARTRPGGGLGLAMVAAVARLHGGELVLSGESGLIATLRLPLRR